MQNPCHKKCPERSPTCHSECERYEKFARERREMLDERKKQNVIEDYFASTAARRRRKKKR